MKSVFRSFPLAVKMIVTDPVNFVLAIFPTIIALSIYLFTIIGLYRNSDRLVLFFRGYIYDADQATFLARTLTAILIIFMFFIMSWTFILVVGIISAPFNSLLSARIEQKLVQRVIMDEDQNHAMSEIKSSLKQTFKNELKKVFVLAIAAGLAFVLNVFPIFYPLAVFIIATLFAVQFVDYTWSRHNLHFQSCMIDTFKNIIPYSLSGFIFLGLVAIPLVNAFVPALATSYFTVLWLHRQKKIE